MLKKTIMPGIFLFVSAFALPMNALKPSGKGIKLDITSDGKSYYTILLPSTPTSQDEAAARILRDTIQKISGAVLPTYPRKC